MRYREFMPHPAVRPWVRYLWFFHKNAADEFLDSDFFGPEPSAHWVCILKGAYLQEGPAAREYRGSVAFLGQRDLVVCRCPGELMSMGICFRMGGAAGLGLFDGEDVQGITPWDHPWARDLAMELEHIPGESPAEAWFKVMEAHLLRLVPRDNNQLQSVEHCLLRQGHRMRIQGLALGQGCSCRHLERCFRMNTGYSPREFKSVMAVSRARHWMFVNPLIGISELAMELGFCDQAHFSRVFKIWSGMSPGEYRRIIKPWQEMMIGENQIYGLLLDEEHSPLASAWSANEGAEARRCHR